MDIKELDGLGLAELVKNGEMSALELVDASITEIERLNPKLNAVVHKQYERAREIAQGPLPDGPFKGVPFLLKDLGAFEKGMPQSSGSRYLKNYKADFQSELVSRYYRSGLIPIGRTNTPEFGIAPTTESEFLGPSKNPWNEDHISGGSSGGSAAAVSSGMVALAHASDGGGSIRIPASCCGVFGLKPTEGRSPCGPMGGRFWHGLAVNHVISRSVRDSAAALDVIAGKEPGAAIHTPLPSASFLEQLKTPVSNLRIGLIEEPYFEAKLHKDCSEAVNDAARLCESLGHTIEITKFNINSQKVADAFLVVVAAETSAAIEALTPVVKKKATKKDLELFTYVCAIGGRTFSASDFSNAVRVLDEARMQVAATFETYDVILTPTLALPPPKLGALAQTPIEILQLKFLRMIPLPALIKKAFREIPKTAFRFTPFTFLFNITGQPAMSAPLYWNQEGLPIGSQFIGGHGEDALLLQLAKQLDEARPFTQKRPTIYPK